MQRSISALRRLATRSARPRPRRSPHMLVVGQKEEADGTVSVRSRFKGDEGSRELSGFISDVKEEIAGRVNRPVEVEKKEN